MASPMEFGPWLRQLRESKERMLRELAAVAAMDQSHLGKVERGQRLPKDEQAMAMARFLDVPVADMRARLVAARLLKACAGDHALAVNAAGFVQEAAAPYLVNKSVNRGPNKK
ncbi:MAG: helix-turn-helix transcriptional regulator [Opitutaceae bacterium]